MKTLLDRHTGAARALLAALLLAALPFGGVRSPAEEGLASWYGPGFEGKKSADGSVFDKEKLTAAHRDLPFGTYLLVRNLDNGASVVVRVTDRGPFAGGRVLDVSEAAARHLGMIPTGTARVSFEPLPAEESLTWTGGALDGAPPASAQAPAEGLAAAGQATAGAAQAAAGQATAGARQAAAEAAPASQAAPATSTTVQTAGSPASGSAAAIPRAAPAASAPVAKPAETRWRIQVASYSNAANASATVDRLRAAGLAATIEKAGPYNRVVFASLSEEIARAVQRKLDVLGYRGYTVTAISAAKPAR